MPDEPAGSGMRCLGCESQPCLDPRDATGLHPIAPSRPLPFCAFCRADGYSLALKPADNAKLNLLWNALRREAHDAR